VAVEVGLYELSVIIPVYNRQDHVVRALESVLTQGVKDLEVLVVDDGSTPPLQLPEPYCRDARVRLLSHATNRGAAAARNTGMHAARGTWIAFLDSDDFWLPGTLAPRLARARDAAAAGAHPLLVYVAGFDLVRARRRGEDVRIPVASSDVLDFAAGCWFSPGSTALFRREPMIAYVGDQDETLRRFEDVDWFLRIALAGGGISTYPAVIAEIEIGSKPRPEFIDQQATLMLQKAMSIVAKSAVRGLLLRRLKAYLAIERASSYWYAGQRLNALYQLILSWLLVPRLRLFIGDFWPQQVKS
jgi:glycosyltransferase involved in cell wall biosynthesis